MHDTIIIGAGIAGLTAAIYASRKRMNFEIIAKEFGGQFNVSSEVLNYPGIVETTGPDFSAIMKEQMKFNNINVREENILNLTAKDKHFIIRTDKGEYETKTVIIATGSNPRKLGVLGEDEFSNKGLAYCAICDGPLFFGRDVAVIGGGNSALEAVDFLKDIAKSITIVVDKLNFSGHEYLVERARSNPKVRAFFNVHVKEIVGDKFVTGLKYHHEGKDDILEVGGIFVEIGRIPSTEIFRDIVEMMPSGHIKIDCQTKTSVPGIFAAGDCASGQEYQYVIAAGQGCMALIKAAKYLAYLDTGEYS